MWVIVSIRPHQDHNSVLEPTQANEPLLAIRFAVVFPGEHWLIEKGGALRQINPMLSQVELLLGGVIAHVLFIVYALNGPRNGVAEQAVGADRDTAPLDTASRGRSTAALCGAIWRWSAFGSSVRTSMTKPICIALSLIWVLTVQAQDQTAEVLLFGVFHFANPGRDVVRVDQVDVSTPANQAYLDGLAQRLCEFRPTTILLEVDRARESDIRNQLDSYSAGKSELPGINEIYQIGFRVAKACGVEKIYGFDESEIGWGAEPLFEYLGEIRARRARGVQRRNRATAGGGSSRASGRWSQRIVSSRE